MDWQTGVTFISILAGSLSLGMGLLLWQYRALASTKPLMGTALAIALWALIYTLELQAGANLDRLLLWNRVKYIGLVFVETFTLIFVLDYIGQDIIRWRTLLWLIVPVITLGLVWTNYNNWMWESVSMITTEGIPYLQLRLGVWGQLFFVYQTILLIIAGLLLFSKEQSRPLRVLVVIAIALPIIVRQGVLSSQLTYDVTPLALAAMMVMLVFGVLQIGVFDVLPDAYDTVVKNNPDGVLVVDIRNRILMMNPTAIRLMGIHTHRAIGSNLFEVLPVLKTWLNNIDTVRAGIVEATDRGRNIEMRIIPLFDRSTFKGRAFLVRDMTERKRAEQAVRESEARYRTLFDQAQDAIIVEDHKLNIIDANRATMRLLGYKYEELVKMTSDVIQPEAVRFDTPPIQNGRIEMKAVRRDGSKIDVEVTIAPIPDKDKLIYMSIMRDVTERKRIQAELKNRADELAQLYEQVSHLEQYKTDMIRMAAHDLRHPISVTLGYLELLEDKDNTLTEAQQKFVKLIKQSIHRADKMLSDILSLERIEQQAKDGVKDQFNFHSLLGEIIAQFRDRAIEKRQRIYLEIDPDDSPYDVIGDASQIIEAVGNLLSNAIKYTPDEGEITIRLSNNGNQVIFEVRDTGYGVPKEQQDRLFRPFFRAKTSETSHIEGTGLGLHLVKNIIERHGGQIVFRSTYGEGSTFGFRLPLLRRGAVVPPQANATKTSTQTLEVPRVILPTID